jgi:heterotetrameric sarcosine oxidase gamma subunit
MADASYIPVALHLTVDLDRHSRLREPIESVLGVPLAAPNRLSGVDPLILWQGHHDWLILCDKVDSDALLENLAKAVDDKPVLITNAGDGLAAFAFTDPDAATQLSSGTGLDLTPETFLVGASAIARFAQLRSIIYRKTDGYTLIVERQYARHVELWLARPRY